MACVCKSGMRVHGRCTADGQENHRQGGNSVSRRTNSRLHPLFSQFILQNLNVNASARTTGRQAAKEKCALELTLKTVDVECPHLIHITTKSFDTLYSETLYELGR